MLNIKTESLTRKFRDLVAVDYLNLEPKKIHERSTLQRHFALDGLAQMSYNELLVNECSFIFAKREQSF